MRGCIYQQRRTLTTTEMFIGYVMIIGAHEFHGRKSDYTINGRGLTYNAMGNTNNFNILPI